MVRSGFPQDFGFFFEAGEQFEIWTGFSENYPGMRPESNDESLGKGSGGKVFKPGKQVLMPPVNAVKNPDGNAWPDELE